MLATLLTPGESSAHFRDFVYIAYEVPPGSIDVHDGHLEDWRRLVPGPSLRPANFFADPTAPEMAPLIRDSTWTTTNGSRGRRMARSTLRSSDKMTSSLVIRRHRMMMTFGPTMGVLASVSMAITVAAPTSSMQGCVPDARMPSCQSDPTHKPSNTRPCRQ